MNDADSAFQNRNASDKQIPGESPDFSKLYDQYAATLLGVLTKLVKDESRAMTQLEVVFRKFMDQADQLQRAKQPLFVCLLQMARQTAIDSLNENRSVKSAALQVSREGKISFSEGPMANAVTPFNGQSTSAEAQQKELLDCILFKNCTPEEAASSLGIPIERARQQLRLAVQQMRNPKA